MRWMENGNKKPEDWDDNEKIDDPEDAKPEDWEQPEHIADPDAKKPDDWDDEMDGEWEHPEIDNPEYEADDKLYLHPDIGAIGIDVWQVKSGTIFDNILVTDDESFAEKEGDRLWGATKDGEKTMKDAQDEEERKQREAEAAEAGDAGDEDEDEEDFEDEDMDLDGMDMEDEEIDHDEL